MKNISSCFRIILVALVMVFQMTLEVLAKPITAPLVSGQSTYHTVTVNYSSIIKVSGFEVSYTLDPSTNPVIAYSGIKTSTTITNLPIGSTIIVSVKSFLDSGSKRIYSEPNVIKISIELGTPTLKSTSKKGVNTLSWSKVEGASSYELSVSTAYSGQYKVISNLNGLTYSHKVGSSAGRYYRIRAYTIVDGRKTYGAYSKVIYTIS